MNETELMHKFNFIFVNGTRYYYENLLERDCSLDNTFPYVFSYNSEEITARTWFDLLYKIIILLERINPLNDKLRLTRYVWTTMPVFYNEEKVNSKKIRENLYLNCNLSAVHCMWAIQDLFKFHKVDISTSKLLIYKAPGSEPKEVFEFYKEKRLQQFKYNLSKFDGYDEEHVTKVVKNINTINKYMSLISPLYCDLFCFDDYSTFYNYQTRLIVYLNDKVHYDEKNISLAKHYISYLTDFYKNILNN